MPTISFKVKFSTGDTGEVKDVESDSTVGEVKKILHERNLAGVEPERQRLIFRGRILNDEQTLEAAGVQDGHTIHLVKSSTAKSSTTTTSSSPAGAMPAQPPRTSPFAAAPPPPSPFGGDPFGGPGGMAGLLPPGMPPPSPEMLRGMMENPMVQRMLENPDTIRAMINSNPMLQAMIQQNPQLEHVLSDPQTMRQAMQAATNPAVMQELMRSQDRALANIESLPGGHNALRRMYEQDIDPMVRAAEETSERMYEQQQRQQQQQHNQQQQEQGTTGGPSASPMPNPWSQPPQQQQQRNPWAGMMAAPPPPPAAGANPWASMMGGGGAMSPMQAMMSDPDMMRRMMEPANMQAMMQLQQAVQQLQRGGVFPEGAFGPMMGGGSGFPSNFASSPTTAAPPPPAPEIRFANELSQLESMGFVNRADNIRALVSTNGNVNAAIERLLQQ